MLKIAVFASGRGSNFRALYEAINEKSIPARVVVVVSNNSNAGVMALAKSFQIPAVHLSQRQFTTEVEFVNALLEVLEKYQVELIVLAGYMKKIAIEIIHRYSGRIINIHPALLPAFGGQGMFGHHVHDAVIASGVRESGATVHLVNEEYDRGPIILQEKVPICNHETAESLAEKVLVVEHQLLPRAVEMIARHQMIIAHNTVNADMKGKG